MLNNTYNFVKGIFLILRRVSLYLSKIGIRERLPLNKTYTKKYIKYDKENYFPRRQGYFFVSFWGLCPSEKLLFQIFSGV